MEDLQDQLPFFFCEGQHHDKKISRQHAKDLAYIDHCYHSFYRFVQISVEQPDEQRRSDLGTKEKHETYAKPDPGKHKELLPAHSLLFSGEIGNNDRVHGRHQQHQSFSDQGRDIILGHRKMPDHMLQRQPVDIQGKVGDQIGEHQKSSPLQRLPEPWASAEKTVKHRSRHGEIYKAGRLACDEDQEPVLRDQINAEPRHIPGGKHGVITEISPVIQVQTIFHVSVIAEDRSHQKNNRPQYHRHGSHGIFRHKEGHGRSDPAEKEQEDIIVSVCDFIIPAHNKAAGVQRLSHRRTEDRHQPHQIQKFPQLIASHKAVQKRVYQDLQDAVHQKRPAYGIRCIRYNSFLSFS